VSDFSVPEAAQYAGVTYARLDRWIRQDQILGRPLAVGQGSGHPRRVTWADVVFLRSVAHLLDAGISYRRIRESIEDLREQYCNNSEPLALVAMGRSVCWVRSHDEIIEGLRGGQLVMAAAFREDVVADLRRRSGLTSHEDLPRQRRA
jgi:MerR HTH family regulatory protein